MAKLSRTDSTKKKKVRKPPKKKIGVVLPTEYEEPVDDINRYSFLIHGEKKIGKTSLSLQGGKVLLLQNDPPQLAYRRLELVTSTWELFRKALRELEKLAKKPKRFPYDRIVVDGADTWYKRCQHWVCEERGIQHPEDEGWGRGWDALRQEFDQAVTRLLSLPCGVWFLCHSTWKEIETRRGDKIEKLVPKLTSMGEEILNGKVDAWLAYDFDGNRRVLFLQGDERTGAGHRLDVTDYPHFRDKKGEPLKYIRMGKSPSTAYKRLLAAFNNEYSHPSKKRK